MRFLDYCAHHMPNSFEADAVDAKRCIAQLKMQIQLQMPVQIQIQYAILAICMSVKINLRQTSADAWINQFVNINKTTEIIFRTILALLLLLLAVAKLSALRHGWRCAWNISANTVAVADTIVSHGFHHETSFLRSQSRGLWTGPIYESNCFMASRQRQLEKLTHYK